MKTSDRSRYLFIASCIRGASSDGVLPFHQKGCSVMPRDGPLVMLHRLIAS